MFSPTSKPFNVAIVGCGLIGNKRAQVLAADPESRLSAVADPDTACAEALRAEFRRHDEGKRDPARLDKSGGGAGSCCAHDQDDSKEGRHGLGWPAVCADWRETLVREKPDAVIIATPNKFSAAIVTAVAALGMHVLCEKPLGRNIGESHEMVAAAATNQVVLKTGFNHRHHPAIYRAHELAASGTIGPVYFIRCVYGHGGRPGYEKEWRASRDVCGGGEMLDQGVHVVDLFRWFLGEFDEAYGIMPTFYWNMEVVSHLLDLSVSQSSSLMPLHSAAGFQSA